MRTIQSFFVLLASIMIVAPSAAQAADIAVFPVETTNLAPEDAIAVGELLAQSYAASSRQGVLSPARTHDVLSKSASYEAAAASLGVAEYLRLSALAAGRRIVISATRYRADGAFVYQSKMTADSVEDITVVSDRLAKALYNRVDDEQVRTRHNVTLAEGRPETRRFSEKVMGFKTGLHFPIASGASYKPHLSLQFDGRLEMDRFFLEFGAGVVVPTSVDESEYCYAEEQSCTPDNDGHLGGISAEIGGSYFLTDGNIAPYVGAGVIPRLVFQNQDVAAVLGYAQLGVMLPRDASTRFYVDARVAQSLLAMHLDNGKKAFPTELTVHVGVGW